MEKEISSKNTKNQILEAYEELMGRLRTQKSEEPKKLQEEAKKVEVIKKASSNSTEGIIKEIGSLKLGVAKELDKLSEQLTDEYNSLENIQKAITLEKQNLEELYQLTANTDSLAAMLMAQKEKRAQFEAEMDASKMAFEEKMKAEKTAFDEKMGGEKETFENAINKQKELWKAEGQKWADQQKELKETTEKQRKREEEEYMYNLKLVRKKETDLYEEKKAKLEKGLAEKKAAFEKEISEREAKVLENETELKELSTQAANFPKELEKAIAVTEKSITEKLTVQFNFEKELTANKNEGEQKLKDQTITTLQSKIKDLESSLKEFSGKASTAEANVKDIAIKAIESSRKLHIIDKNKEQEKE